MNGKDYEAKWLKYCRACNGIGGHKKDPAKFPTPCPGCYGRGMCGRCGAEMLKYAQTCAKCGWTAYTPADALPGGITSDESLRRVAGDYIDGRADGVEVALPPISAGFGR